MLAILYRLVLRNEIGVWSVWRYQVAGILDGDNNVEGG